MCWAHALMCILMVIIPSSLYWCGLVISVIELKWPHGISQGKWGVRWWKRVGWGWWVGVSRLGTTNSTPCYHIISDSVWFCSTPRGSSPRLCIWWCRSRSHEVQTCCWTGWGAGGTALLGRHSCPDRWWLACARYQSNTWKRRRAEF